MWAMIDRSVSGRRIEWWRTSRSPSTMSSRMRVGDVRTGRGGSGLRMSTIETAETTYEIASTRIANGAPMTCTSAPARPWPADLGER